MDILLIISQVIFLIMGILGAISSSVTSLISMKIATVIYFMSAIISFHKDSWLPLVIGLIALLVMKYFGFEPTGKEARDNARQILGLDDLGKDILSKKNNKSQPKKKQPTQKEFWDGIREGGVTPAEINARMRAEPSVPQSDRLTFEQEIIKSTLFNSQLNGVNLIHEVILPLSKIQFLSEFKDYHKYTEYINLINLVQELIDPDYFNSNMPSVFENIYNIFDQDRQYIFSYSGERGVYFLVNPVPECNFFQSGRECGYVLSSFQKDTLRFLLRIGVDKKLDDNINLECVQVALHTHLGLYLQEGDEKGAEVFLSLRSIVTSAKSIGEIEKYLD